MSIASEALCEAVAGAFTALPALDTPLHLDASAGVSPTRSEHLRLATGRALAPLFMHHATDEIDLPASLIGAGDGGVVADPILTLAKAVGIQEPRLDHCHPTPAKPRNADERG